MPRLDLQVNAHWGGSQSQGQSLSSASSQFSKAGEPDRKHQFPPSCFPPGALGHKQSSPTLRPPELTAAEQSAGDKDRAGSAMGWVGAHSRGAPGALVLLLLFCPGEYGSLLRSECRTQVQPRDSGPGILVFLPGESQDGGVG